MAYELIREKGKVISIKRLAEGEWIPLDMRNVDFRAFLKWNAQQDPPLDLSDQFDLVEYKQDKRIAIDAKTQSLISNGFSFASKTFSLSQEAQLNWTNLFQFRAGFSYPKKISTKDHDEHSLADQAAVVSFCQAALSAVNGHLDSGRALKLLVRAATNKAEVDSIIDDRT